MTLDNANFDAVVIGGGLAGLAAAAYLARDGHTITVLERSTRLGGRAHTKEANGFLYNQGPHALYRGGEAAAVLEELGVEYAGHAASVAGSAIRNGRVFTLPVGGRSLMTTRLFGVRDRIEAARLLLAFRKVAAEGPRGVSVSRWLESESNDIAARQYVEAVIRLACYANAPGTIDVTDAARQFVGAAAGVLYLDGGWATLVEGLREQVTQAGGTVQAGAKVSRIEQEGHRWAISIGDGRRLTTAAVVLAVSPGAASELLPGSADLATRHAAAVPALAACLDVSVSKMPVPRRRFAIGIDAPLYYSVHTKVARLAPAGMQTLSVAKYLHPDAPNDPAGSLIELEHGLDLLQPGWREHEVSRQYLPEMTVTTSLSSAAAGGMAGRRGPAVDGASGVFVAGDWAGAHGWLADAALGSAREAARLASASLASVAPALASVS